MVDIKIQDKRSQIAQIDEHIAELCQQRIILAEEVFKLKKERNCPIVDMTQEREVYSRYDHALNKATTPERLKKFVNSLIELSQTYPSHTKEIL